MSPQKSANIDSRLRCRKVHISMVDVPDNQRPYFLNGFDAGAQALEEILLEESREFDPDAIRGACCAYILKNKFTMNNIEAAHWQFNQLQPIIQAQKARIAELEQTVNLKHQLIEQQEAEIDGITATLSSMREENKANFDR